MLDRSAYYKSLLPNSGLIKEAGLNRGGFARAFFTVLHYLRRGK